MSGYSLKDLADVVQNQISHFYPSLHDKAISILNSCVDYCNIGAGLQSYEKFNTYRNIRYRIKIYVQSTCLIGTCDIHAELRDELLDVVKVFRRVSVTNFEMYLI